jgi:hypothetical protein
LYDLDNSVLCICAQFTLYSPDIGKNLISDPPFIEITYYLAAIDKGVVTRETVVRGTDLNLPPMQSRAAGDIGVDLRIDDEKQRSWAMVSSSDALAGSMGILAVLSSVTENRLDQGHLPKHSQLYASCMSLMRPLWT